MSSSQFEKVAFNYDNFFPHLIIHPEETVEKEKWKSWLTSVLLGIATLGLLHLGCWLHERRLQNTVVEKKPEERNEPQKRIHQQAQAVFKNGDVEDISKKSTVALKLSVPLSNFATPSFYIPVSLSVDFEILDKAKEILEENYYARRLALFEDFFGSGGFFHEKGHVSDQAKRERLQQLGNGPEGLSIIYRLSSLFGIEHWRALKDEQVQALDFAEMEKQLLEQSTTEKYPGWIYVVYMQVGITLFHALPWIGSVVERAFFSTLPRMVKLGTREDEQVKANRFRHFLRSHESDETECRIALCVDGSRMTRSLAVEAAKKFSILTQGFSEEEKENTFDYFFKTAIYGSLHLWISDLGATSEGLETLYTLTPYFYVEHWKALSLDQIEKIDLLWLFSGEEKKVISKYIRYIFPKSTYHQTKERIQAFYSRSPEQFKVWSPYFSKYHFDYLNPHRKINAN